MEMNRTKALGVSSIIFVLFLFFPSVAFAYDRDAGTVLNAPVNLTWNDPPDGSCAGYTYQTVQFYDPTSGKAYAPPWKATMPAPVNFTFSCSNNVGDPCLYPLEIGWIYGLCSNTGLWDQGWSVAFQSSDVFTINAPLETASISRVSTTTLTILEIAGGFGYFLYANLPFVLGVSIAVSLIFWVLRRLMEYFD
jgi:hypothetical protein